MVSLRRGFDRFFALSLATSPLWNLLYRNGVDYSITVAVASVSLGVATVLLLERGPDHDSGDAWLLAGYTFAGYAVVSVLAEQSVTYTFADEPFVAVATWVMVVAGALVLTARRQ